MAKNNDDSVAPTHVPQRSSMRRAVKLSNELVASIDAAIESQAAMDPLAKKRKRSSTTPAPSRKIPRTDSSNEVESEVQSEDGPGVAIGEPGDNVFAGDMATSAPANVAVQQDGHVLSNNGASAVQSTLVQNGPQAVAGILLSEQFQEANPTQHGPPSSVPMSIGFDTIPAKIEANTAQVNPPASRDVILQPIQRVFTAPDYNVDEIVELGSDASSALSSITDSRLEAMAIELGDTITVIPQPSGRKAPAEGKNLDEVISEIPTTRHLQRHGDVGEDEKVFVATDALGPENYDQNAAIPGTPGPRPNDVVENTQLSTPPSTDETPKDTVPRSVRPRRPKSAIQRFGVDVSLEVVKRQIMEVELNGDGETLDTRGQVPSEAEADEYVEEETPKSKAKRKTPASSKAKRTAKKTPAARVIKATAKTPIKPKAPATPKGKAKIAFAPSRAPKPTITKLQIKSAWISLDLAQIEGYDAKLALSHKLTKQDALSDKPLPQGQPRVWAESRQALCETVPYFKKPHGGCYQNDSHVYAFLFDGLGHCREYVGTDVIICRAGGSMESDGKTGGILQAKDQTFKEAQVQAMLNDQLLENPCVVICGNKNVAAKVKMPHQYCVLGWFKPVMVWSEKTTGKGGKEYTTVKYRLERLNRHKPAWHAPQGEETLTEKERIIAGPLQKQNCATCNQNFPQIYLRSWVCLNADCPSFWKLAGAINGALPTGKETLEYNPAFLLHDSGSWKTGDTEDEPEPNDLQPPIPDVDSYILGDDLAYINTRGICCDNCGRCSSRRFFDRWVCENPSCGREVLPRHQIVKPEMMHTPWDNAPTLLRNLSPVLLKSGDENPGVELKIEYIAGYKVATYSFHKMGIQGSFVHAAPTKDILALPGEADEMFAALQRENMGLERRVFAIQKHGGGKAGNHVGGNDEPEDTLRSGNAETPEQPDLRIEPIRSSKSEFAPGDLMTAFSMNYGMPYKFVATGASRPFTSSPWPVQKTRRILNWAQRTFLKDGDKEFTDFNEELIFAYLQGQKIEYHDDGEEGLGPRIASLSLGCRAKMSLRLKMKHYVGCSKTGIFTEEKPVRGGLGGAAMDARRLEAWNELQAARDSDDKNAYRALRSSLPKGLGLVEKRMKKAEDLVSVSLSHGDIVVMEGYDVQKYLEHKVVPEGCLRFALTCRTVLENHLKEEEKPGYGVEEDPVKYLGPGKEEAEVSVGSTTTAAHGMTAA